MQMTLKAARVNKGLTQKEAAAKLGIGEDTMGRYERGLSFPDVVTLKKIESLYGIGYNELIFLPQNYGKTVTKGA